MATNNNEDLTALRAFAQWVLDGYCGGTTEIGDIDGWALQDAAIEHGLLSAALCTDAEGEEFPGYRPTPRLTGKE